FARTFVLESEVAALKAAGYGTRVTEKDLLVFGSDGVIGNELRSPDECVRHKILDCLGDFALLGCDLVGHISAWRSGHHMNQQLARQIEESRSLASKAA
ncbi:MAG TPA: UDP-3-O-acyl-N-acetylglucosamine deacetylase, partial [Planctomycetaceae bacterium]|nr:UDP-3-O-acyl-N-acetylglucosamine deacetylase [Planctomycetaceae bacterium]